MMRTNLATLTLALFAFSAALLKAQAPAAAPAPPDSGAAPMRPSALLQPSLDVVLNTLNSLNLDKWKKGSVREEAAQNVDSLLRDIQTHLPPLMGAADAAPTSVSAAMPLVKHLDAVYDVLLRVEEASRVAAPSEQIGALQQALTTFGTARFALDDTLQKQASLQEKQIADLHTALARQAEIKTASAKAEEKPCVPPVPAHRRRRHTTPAKKPATPSTPATPPGTKPQ